MIRTGSRLYLDDLFTGLGHEPELHDYLHIEIKGDSRMENITRKFESLLYDEPFEMLGMNKEYEERFQFNQKCSRRDIEQFSLFIKGYQHAQYFSPVAGLFLSSLMNNSAYPHFFLDLRGIQTSLNYLGYRNNKKIFIKGNIGDYLGSDMEGGKIIVEGSSGSFAGVRMSGGLIEIKGNTENRLGAGMIGGKIIAGGDSGERIGCYMGNGEIIVNGNAGENIGAFMKYGMIHLNGEYGSISVGLLEKGNIYNQGKQIISKGKPIPGAEIKWD